jgi:hypothetical protein
LFCTADGSVGFNDRAGTKRTTISGTVTNHMAQPDPDVTVVIFSPDGSTSTEARRVAAVRPDQRGDWEVIGLPEGDYGVGLETPSLYGLPTPARLDKLRAGAKRVTLKEGERTIANAQTR